MGPFFAKVQVEEVGIAVAKHTPKQECSSDGKVTLGHIPS